MEGHRDRQRAYAGGLAFSNTLSSRWAKSLTEPPLGGGQETLLNTEDRDRDISAYPLSIRCFSPSRSNSAPASS